MNLRQKKKLAAKLHGPFDFRKKLVEQLRTKGYDYLRMNESIFFNDEVSVSIQASHAHYCCPRDTVQVYAYENMEVAFYKGSEMVPIEEVITNTSVIRSFDEFFTGVVYAFVPVQIIQKMYADLLVKKGLREGTEKLNPLRDRIKRHKEKTNSNSPSVIIRSVTQEISNDFWRGIKDGLSKIDEVETSNDFNDQAHV